MKRSERASHERRTHREKVFPDNVEHRTRSSREPSPLKTLRNSEEANAVVDLGFLLRKAQIQIGRSLMTLRCAQGLERELAYKFRH